MAKYTLLSFFFLTTLLTQAQEASEADSTARGTMKVNSDFRLAELQERYKKENEGKQISGYRIQLYSGSRKGAFDLKANFIGQFPEDVCNVVYEAPDFKVQVGNYRTQLEAEHAMQEIWPIFKSAFVVETSIDLPALPIEKKK